VPATAEPPKVTAAVVALLQSTWSAGSDTEGVGLMSMVNVCAIPAHVFAVGVTIKVAVTGVVPVFVAENGAILPVPLVANPMLGVLFVHA
jgi:hypothetical protein